MADALALMKNLKLFHSRSNVGIGESQRRIYFINGIIGKVVNMILSSNNRPTQI